MTLNAGPCDTVPRSIPWLVNAINLEPIQRCLTQQEVQSVTRKEREKRERKQKIDREESIESYGKGGKVSKDVSLTPCNIDDRLYSENLLC